MTREATITRRILLVEDEALIALGQKALIEKHGFEVVIANSGEGALDSALHDETVALILMDIDLGAGIDGTEAAQRILEERDLPIVFLTSHTEKEYVDRVRDITSYGYVLKSSGEFVLIESIRMAFQLFEANERAQHREAQIAIERDRFRALTETSPVPIVMVDRNGSLTYANAEAQATLGVAPSEVASRTYHDPRWKITDFDGNPFPERELPFAVVSRTHESVYGVTHAITRPDGVRRYLYINATPVFDELHQFDGMIAVTTDMTDHVQKGEELRESEKRYRDLFENAPVGIFQTDSNGRFLAANPTMARILGAPSPQAVIEHYTDLAHQVYVRSERRDQFLSLLRKHGRVHDFELEARTMQGAHRIFLLNARIHSVLPDGTIIIDGFISDVTERREAEAALEEREENLQTTLQSIGDGIIATDLEGRVTRMNPVAERLTGIPFDEARGKPVAEVFRIVNAETMRPARNPVQRAIRSGATVELENHTMLISRDGTRYQLADSAAPIRDRANNMTGVVMVFRDFTEQYEERRELREARRFLRDVFDSMHDGICVTDENLTITSVNAWMAERFTETRPIEGRKCFEVLYARDSQCPWCPVDNGRHSKHIYERTVEFPANGGQPWWAHLSAYPMTDEDGHISGAIEHIRDVSERKRAEDALRHSERDHRTLFHSIRDAILVADTDRTIINCNQAFTDLFGYRLEEIRGKKTHALYADRKEYEEMGARLRDSVDQPNFFFTIRYRKKNGEVFPGETNAFFGRNDEGDIVTFIGLIRDISTRRQSQRQLEQALAQKDYLMRELNHRVKNNLNMVSSLVDLKDLSLGETVDLSDIRHRIDAIQLIHQKLHEETDVNSIDVREYIDDLLNTLFSSFTSRSVELDNRVPRMRIAAKAALPLGLIANELATNAIEHGFTDDEPARFSIFLSQEAEYYVLEIANTGRPFPEGIELTGSSTLGLQLVTALVDQLDGSIALTRKPSPVFRIRIPRTRLQASSADGEGTGEIPTP